MILELLSTLTPVRVTDLPGSNTKGGLASGDEIQNILQIVFAIVGALAVLVITIAGLRYILSTGDPQRIAQAKDAILYALVGLVVAITAEAIVTFVLGNL